jgi:hypothetical protein
MINKIVKNVEHLRNIKINRIFLNPLEYFTVMRYNLLLSRCSNGVSPYTTIDFYRSIKKISSSSPNFVLLNCHGEGNKPSVFYTRQGYKVNNSIG